MPKMSEEQRQRRALARARDQALAAEERDRRSRELTRQWQREGTYLSWEEFQAGEPCRACGQPWLDGLGAWPYSVNMTEEEKAAYEQADEAFRQRHRHCDSGRCTVQGNRTWHCLSCCPPPPLSPAQIERLRLLLSPAPMKKDVEEDEWELTLTCDHVIRDTQSRERDKWDTAVVGCPACGIRRGVVTARWSGPSEARERKAEAERIAAELKSAKSELRRQRSAAKAADRRVGDLEGKLKELSASLTPHQIQ